MNTNSNNTEIIHQKILSTLQDRNARVNENEHISLRKAAAIQQEILVVIKTLNSAKKTITFNEFDKNIEQMFTAEYDQFIKQQKLANDLLKAYYSLRIAVASLNQQVGINELLANIELTKKLIAQESILLNESTTAMSVEVINLRLNKIRNSDTQSIYSDKEVTTSLITATDRNRSYETTNQYKQQLRQLSDKLLELNVMTKVKLTTEQINTLLQAGII
ncbi:MAG: hypothetical protein EKK57_04265 [Proteobacteria bacterium]|nr:MAG: hypothetical protein EKK57_04265 [Pseudomonadota bacterium]